MLLSISWDINAIKTKDKDFHAKSELIEDIEEITCQHFMINQKWRALILMKLKNVLEK